MSIMIDVERGKKVAGPLYTRTDMPEDIMPNGEIIGFTDHMLFITLTVSIDYQRDAPSLWASSRKTFDDPETRYIFNPKPLKEIHSNKIIGDMQKYGLSKKPRKDACIWRTVVITF
jgi:hypothetical protein